MAARDWTEIRELNGTEYLIQYFEVDAHEGYTSRSSHIVRKATQKDIREHREKSDKRGNSSERQE